MTVDVVDGAEGVDDVGGVDAVDGPLAGDAGWDDELAQPATSSEAEMDEAIRRRVRMRKGSALVGGIASG
jgi:hypothetical protein